MRWSVAVPVLLLVALPASGCLKDRETEDTHDGAHAAAWDEPVPERSALADAPYYELTGSTTFLLKGHEYGRYVVRVPERLTGLQVFFSTSNQFSQARGPSVDDDDYHFEFMQIRPFKAEREATDVNAVHQFRNSAPDGWFTLTYLYGKGVDEQLLAPYHGDPDAWTLEPGAYEFIIATDERLTVGINIRTGSEFWRTLYHPQELGKARAVALDYYLGVIDGVGGRLPELRKELSRPVYAAEGERLHYFAFSDLIYATQAMAVGATGTATVLVHEDPVPHRIDVTTTQPGHAEAYSYAVRFNTPGPVSTSLRTTLDFQEQLSAQSTLVGLMMVYAVALEPTATTYGAMV